VHLAGETDAAHLVAGDAGLGQCAANSLPGGIPPIFGTLFGP
jgi:hypothetical protein